MRIFSILLGRIVTSVFLICLTTGAAAASSTDTSALRDAVTLEAIRDHQEAFQAIADANGGSRHSGSPGADESAAYVAGELETAGYAVEIQEFDLPYFEELSTPEFEQIAPNPTVYTHLDPAGFVTVSYSGSGDVTAPVQGVDIMIPPGGSANTSTSGCEPGDFAAFVPGRIALIQRGSCSFQAKVLNAANAGAVGVIIFNEGQAGRTDAFAGTLGSPTADIPVVASSYAIGESLYMASLGTEVTVRLDVDTISEVRTAFNVLADLTGHYDRVVMAGAHLDSVAEGPGINDNGSGAAALLEIAIQMADLQPKPRNTLRFAWWGAEESGLAGSINYVTGLGMDELKKLNAYLEFEMLGSPNFVRFVYDGDGSAFPPAGPEGSAVIEQIFEGYFADQGLATEPTPLDGRHSYFAFYSSGIPVGGLFGGDFGIKTAAQAAIFGGTEGDQYDPCYHLACDTFDNVSLQALDQMSDAAAHTIQTLAMGSTSSPSNGSGRLTCEDLGYDFSIKAEPDGCRQSSGFWKSNPGAWPVDNIDIGGVTYTRDEAIDIMNAKAKGDKTYSLFIETVAAKLNDMTCGPFSEIAPVIADADAWLALNPPGSGIKSKDSEWDEGGALNAALSAFNGGSFMSGSWSLDGVATVDIETTDGIYFDWTSTRSADAVIVKGGRNVNLYEYDPESFGDIGLHAPINNKTDTPYGLSYVEFCFDWDIDISVRKFNDRNNNGVWDDGEPEIGVDQFINPDGTIGGTDGWPYLFSFPMDTGFIDLFRTPGMHQYSFAGVYTISEQEFLLWDPTALIINDVPQPVSTEANITYDGEADEFVEVVFGNVGFTEILGRKFEDLNGNGAHDDGEPGVPDVEVTLTGTDILGDPVELVTVTGPGGEFAFLNLAPGIYSVAETAWPSALWVPSTATVSGPHVVESGDSLDLDWVFGNLLPGSVHGHKFVDVNGDGVENDGEPGLPGVVIELTGDVDGDGVIDQVQVPTNDSGEYWFTNLWPGDYTVAEIVPDGWIPTTPTDVSISVVSGVERVTRAGQAMLTDEQIAAGYEEFLDESLAFGNFQYGSIHGYKFHDLNADGVWGVGEPGLEGWNIELIDAGGNLITQTVTDADGEYAFVDLGPGTYTVAEALQPDWMPTTANPPPLALQSGQEYVAEDGQAGIGSVPRKFETLEPLLSFGNFQFGSIHGYKFNDLNGNGVDEDEPRLQDWLIELTDTDGNVIDTTVTDLNGEYAFLGLSPGEYSVQEVLQVEWTLSTQNPVQLSVASGQEYVALPGQANLPPGSTKIEILDVRLAFGNYLAASLSGIKFEDLNANAVFDPAEPLVEGVEVTLSGTDGKGNAVLLSTLTNADGVFQFSGLTPGDYTVTETVPPGLLPSTPTSSGPYAVQSGESLDLEWVFGNFTPAEITGIKFDDVNQNGVRDGGEPGLAAVVIMLEGIDGLGNPVNLSTPTGADGVFSFVGLTPGNYTVAEVVPTGWEPTTPISVGPFILLSGDSQDLGSVFGNYLANLPPTANPVGFSATGNVGINVAAPGVLTNATDPNSPPQPLFATAETVVSDQGVSVNIAADGSFSYEPPAGYTGADTFPYEVCDDASACDSGTITITVSNMIWFIDNSAGAGDGRLATPFNSIAAFTGSILPAANDCIYVEESGTAYTGPLTLANGQIVVGEGSSASIDSVCGIILAPGSATLPTTGGTRPVINSATNGVVLASGNSVRGVNIGNTTGSGLSGTNVGAATVIEASINGTGAGVSINTGTLAMDFDELSSSNAAGIDLINVAGDFDVTTGVINSGNATAVSISGNPIDLDVALISVSANGATNGIVIDNTTGSFTINGDGGATQNNSGGSILNTTGDGISLTDTTNITLNQMFVDNTGRHGVFGTGVVNLTVNDSVFEDIGNADTEDAFSFKTESGGTDNNISGTLTLNNVNVTRFHESGLHVYNETGTLLATVSNSSFSDNEDTANLSYGVYFELEGSADATLTVDNNTFDDIESDIVRFETNSSVSNTVNILDNTSADGGGPDNFPNGGGLQVITDGGDVKFDIQGNSLQDLPGDPIIIASTGGGGNVEGSIGGANVSDGNEMWNDAASILGDGILLTANDSIAVGKTWTVLIQNNFIGQNGAGSITTGMGDDGIGVLLGDNNGVYNITIEENTIRSVDPQGEGIDFFVDEDGNDAVPAPVGNVRIANNDIISVGAFEQAIEIDTREIFDGCFHIVGNENGAGGALPGVIEVSQGDASILEITQASIAALSTANAGSSVFDSGIITFNGACTNPPLPTP